MWKFDNNIAPNFVDLIQYLSISYNFNFSTQREGYSDIENKNINRYEQQNI